MTVVRLCNRLFEVLCHCVCPACMYTRTRIRVYSVLYLEGVHLSRAGTAVYCRLSDWKGIQPKAYDITDF